MVIFAYKYIYIYFFHIFLSSTSNIYGGPLLKSSCFPSCGIIGCPWNLDSMRVFKLSHSDKTHIDATFQNIQQLIVAGNHHAEWFVEESFRWWSLVCYHPI